MDTAGREGGGVERRFEWIQGRTGEVEDFMRRGRGWKFAIYDKELKKVIAMCLDVSDAQIITRKLNAS